MNKFKSTVVQSSDDSDNIFYVGNIVVCKYDASLILIVTGSCCEYFWGTVISHALEPRIGCNEDDWAKEGFKQFHGSVTLER